MTVAQYLLDTINMKVGSYRFLGLLCQLVIVLLCIYAGTIYPPLWVSKKSIQDYVPSVFPFAVIVTIAIYLIVAKEKRIYYEDEVEDADEPETDGKDKDIEAQSGS